MHLNQKKYIYKILCHSFPTYSLIQPSQFYPSPAKEESCKTVMTNTSSFNVNRLMAIGIK